jgi:uncharacterized protein (DUF58 family)
MAVRQGWISWRALREAGHGWARRRQGEDPDPVTLASRRVYILPTGLGLAYGTMVFAMALGAMNYANNLALGLAFLLGSLAMVAMHHCHGNITGLRIASSTSHAVFAGGMAEFCVVLENDSRKARHELVLHDDVGPTAAHHLPAAGRRSACVRVPAPRRGRLRADSFGVATRYPFGLFRAWTWLHMPLECVVFPRPSERDDLPPPSSTDVGSAQDTLRGEEDFAGLRVFHAGDAPSRIAWKVYARGQGLHVKQYAGTSVASHVFDFDELTGLDVESRLSLMTRWVLDAHTAGRAYGLRLPGTTLAVNLGPQHRDRCLTALALYDGEA